MDAFAFLNEKNEMMALALISIGLVTYVGLAWQCSLESIECDDTPCPWVTRMKGMKDNVLSSGNGQLKTSHCSTRDPLHDQRSPLSWRTMVEREEKCERVHV